MPVCPKCGFNGQNTETCERCGIIYSRMHTILESRPASLVEAVEAHARRSGSVPALQTPTSVPPVSDPIVSSSTGDNTIVDISHVAAHETPVTASERTPVAGVSRPSGRVVPVLAQAFPGMAPMPTPPSMDRTPAYTTRPPREATVVPMVPPLRRRSRAPVLIGLFLVAVGAWGIDRWMDYRHRKFSLSVSDTEAPADVDYFQFRASELVEDARRQLREVKDLDRAKKQREELGARVRHLKTRVVTASLPDEQKATVNHALDELLSFLEDDVGPILVALEAERPKPEEDGIDGEEQPAGDPPAIASPSPAPAVTPVPVVALGSPAPKPAASRKPNLAALNRALSLLAALKVE